MKFGFESNDYKVALAVSFMLAFVVFLPVMLGHNFPLWSTDNLFGSYPPLEISRRQFLSGDAAWFPLAGRGIDFSASVNNFSYSPIFRLIFFSSAGATFIASAIVQFICFWGVGFISYFIAKNIVKDRNSALFALIAYQLSFATLYYLQTFPNIVLQFFFLLAVLLVQNSTKINTSLLASILATVFSTILLTGHVVYGLYFMVAHLLVAGHCLTQLSSKKERVRLIVAYSAGVILAAIIAQYRLIPFFWEVTSGSRVTSTFVAAGYRPLAFFHLFVPEIFGISINKTSELSTLLTLRSDNFRSLGLSDMHSTFLYCGIAGILLMLGAAKIKAARFWFFISLLFVLEVAVPGLVGIFSNAVFYPFQHNSHIYLASFFWTITAAITVSHLPAIQTSERFERFLSLFQVVFPPFVLGTVLSIYAAFMFWQNSALWIAKSVYMLITIALILYIYKYSWIQNSSSVRPISLSTKRLIGMTIASLVLASFAFVFSSPVGRNAVLFLSVSIAIMGLGFPMLERKMPDYADRQTSVIWILILIALAYAASELVIPLIPQLGSIDYPVDGYFRLANEYSRLNVWPNEWFMLVVLSLYKLYLVVFWLLSKLRSSSAQPEKRPVAVFLILLALTDQLPTFLEYAHYISRPFVRVEYNKLFEHLKNNPDTEHLGYRMTNVHKALPISTLFDYRTETEVLSNLPYAYGYRSYGGVNSQISKRERVFYDTYIESRTINDKLPNQQVDTIGVGTNFTDEGLLVLLGVKYSVEGRSDNPVQTPVLVGHVDAYNIVHYGSNYYGIPQAAGPLDLGKTDPAKIPGILVASSLIGVKSDIERQSAQMPVLVDNVGAYNIVHYGSNYYGIPQAAGSLDLSKSNLAKIPGVLVASSLSEVYCLLSKQGEQTDCDQKPTEINYKEYPFALSRIMLYSSYRVAGDVAEISRMVRYGLVDLEKEIIVENKIPFASSPKKPRTHAYKELGYDHIRVEVENGNSDRILLFNDTYNSGWKASADGRELEVIPANGISMAVVLPEDAKVVDLVFQPKGTYYFKLVHKLGLALLIASLIIGLFKQKVMHRVKSYMF